MKTLCNPNEQARYRVATRHQISTTAQRNCQGPCKKRRSLTQFAGDDVLCLMCRRRAPKDPE